MEKIEILQEKVPKNFQFSNFLKNLWTYVWEIERNQGKNIIRLSFKNHLIIRSYGVNLLQIFFWEGSIPWNNT